MDGNWVWVSHCFVDAVATIRRETNVRVRIQRTFIRRRRAGKAWTKGVPLGDAARQQLLNAAQLPFVFKWIAAMPDVHWGIGATVGSVIPTKGAIIPAAVGVDIGCGMMAVQKLQPRRRTGHVPKRSQAAFHRGGSHAYDRRRGECREDEDVIDETPAAYKLIDAVMAAQTDLVEVVHNAATGGLREGLGERAGGLKPAAG
jgi:RNA-splicing ligase RtcB